MMVDYARITGSFPAILDDAGTLETTVQICINASKLHPTGKSPALARFLLPARGSAEKRSPDPSVI